MLRLLEERVAFENLLGHRPRPVEQVAVGEAGDAEHGVRAALHAAPGFAFASHLEVDFRKLEAVGCLHHRLQALAGIGARVLFGAEEHAEALERRASHAAAKLVKLAQPEPFRAFNDDDGGVGHVDADLDDAGRYERIRLAPRETPHDLVLLFAGHAAVEQVKAVGAQRTSSQPLELLLGRAHVECFRLLHQWADDEGLLTGVQVLPDEGVGFVALVGFHPDGRHRLPAGRHLVDCRDLEVPVYGQRQGARDGRRRHDQQVRVVALLAQLRTLHHTETVLFVDDGQPEARHLHVVFEQRMRADDDVRAPVSGVAANLHLLRGRERAGEEEHAQAPAQPFGCEDAVKNSNCVSAKQTRK